MLNRDLSTWVTVKWRDALRLQAAQAERAGDVSKAQKIHARLHSAVVVAHEDLLPGRVQFGSWVTIFSIEEEEEQSFEIVSADQSLSGRDLMDQSSPLAQALLGAREGQVVRVTLPSGANCEYEVTHIRIPQN